MEGDVYQLSFNVPQHEQTQVIYFQCLLIENKVMSIFCFCAKVIFYKTDLKARKHSQQNDLRSERERRLETRS